MERKILIAVDDSIQSKHAVTYVGRLMAADVSVHFDLLNIQPAVSDFLLEEVKKKPASRRHLDQLLSKNAQHSRQLLSKLSGELIASGVADGRVSVHTAPRNLGVAKDILDFGLERRLDAIVLGRRGVSGIQDALFGSVSNTIAQQSQVLPVWMVDSNTVPNRIFMPVDGSMSSLRAVDHVAFMLAGRKEIRFVFFHVQPKLRHFCPIDVEDAISEPIEDMMASEDVKCIDNFFGKVLHRFAEFEIGEDQIDFKTKSGLGGVGGMILKELTDGDYDTVVMGRRGANRSFFIGSVTQYILGKSTNRTVWIVP
jgi:nucleotide-binding universal stress UspA family protein